MGTCWLRMPHAPLPRAQSGTQGLEILVRVVAFQSFRPYLLQIGPYSVDRFGRDLSAGVTVGFVALPLAMAFAIASGLKPEAGLVTAIVAGFLVSALGGSRVQIGARQVPSLSSYTASLIATD